MRVVERHLQRLPDARRHAPADQVAAVAHRARRGVALAPAERLRALAVAFLQLLAGVGQAVVLVAVRVAANAQFHRVELERDGEFVHRAFERIDAGGGTRRAHVAGRGDVEPRELVLVFGVGALVERAAHAVSLRENSSYCEVMAIASWVIASSVPSALAPSATRSMVAGR